ncbi:hypothetical protein [Clavibacter michiganensis]|uniref:hypothetical protein n=1 Tax=Clavibacter michiganensis TaxID=28447 RepID=UPI0014307E60|nr:hypothetical protein [Clavibacter michiganensis]MDO4144217.1 hypothetical protein [Clavibacter michiganensis]QIT13054.1 hypothetical protein GRD74_15835 [Clavibacter michiganensis subsp. michiganensis]
MSSRRNKRNIRIRFTWLDVLGLFLSALAIGCGVASFFVAETRVLLGVGLMLMVAGQVPLWIRFGQRIRRDDAQRSKR